jgi:transposase
MAHTLQLRERAVKYVRDGGNRLEASRIFGIHRQTLWRWLQMEDLKPQQQGLKRRRKLDKAALLAQVQAQPDMILRERAAHFGVHINSIWVALGRLNISKKNDALRGKKL